jgi:hypothetical protein
VGNHAARHVTDDPQAIEAGGVDDQMRGAVVGRERAECQSLICTTTCEKEDPHSLKSRPIPRNAPEVDEAAAFGSMVDSHRSDGRLSIAEKKKKTFGCGGQSPLKDCVKGMKAASEMRR